MKLAKKMLASVVALALVAAFALTAFAAAPVVSLTATDAVVGENVTITVAAKDMAGLESADLEFTYDATALEFVSVKQAEGAEFTMALGGNPEAGVATFSFAFVEAAKEDSALCTITFKVLKADATTVTLKYNSWGGTEEPAEATVEVKEKVVETTAPTTEAPAEDTSKAPTTDNKIPQTGEAGVAAIAGVMALAAVAFVATRKKDEE